MANIFARRSLGKDSLANLVCSAALSLARHFSGKEPNSSHIRAWHAKILVWHQSKQTCNGEASVRREIECYFLYS
jgi:hypothetical protein